MKQLAALCLIYLLSIFMSTESTAGNQSQEAALEQRVAELLARMTRGRKDRPDVAGATARTAR